jgi:hypothetical protein
VTVRNPVPLEHLRERAGGSGLLQLGTLYAYAATRTGGDPDALADVVQEVQERGGSDALFAFLVKVSHTAAILAQDYAAALGFDLGELLDSFEMDELQGLAPGDGE